MAATTIIDWRASHETWDCPWWPMSEKKHPNLYAPNGPLAKYDMVYGTKACQIEKQRDFREPGDVDSGWAGHCNLASQVVCVISKPPMHDCTYKGVTFTKEDVCGLLCVVSPGCLCTVPDHPDYWWGKRYGDPPLGKSKDPNEPLPHKLLEGLKRWLVPAPGSKTPLCTTPFVADTDPTDAVWNYPFDAVKVTRVEKEYTFAFSSTAYHKHDFTIKGIIDGPDDSHWTYVGPKGGKPRNPDFLWRPKIQAKMWEGRSTHVRDKVTKEDVITGESVKQIYDLSIK